MKTVYTGSKNDGRIAVAVDIDAIRDPKNIGAFLKLIGECGFVVDRVEPFLVSFSEPKLTNILKDDPDKGQLELPTGGEIVGPSEMGEGFVCNYSGGCPNERKSCTSCEYAGSIFGTPVPTAEQPEEMVTVAENEGPNLGDEIQNSEFSKWANQIETAENEDPNQITENAVFPGDEDEGGDQNDLSLDEMNENVSEEVPF